MAAIHQSHTTLKKIDDLSKIKRRTHQFRHFLNISALYYSTISPLKNPFTNTTLIPQFNKFSNGESQIIFSKNTNNSSINMEVKVMQHSTSFLVPSSEQKPSSLTYALVILNQRLPRFAPLLWEHAKLRVCADGGANRLFDEIPNFFPQLNPADVRNRYKPDVIKGDMDSVRSEVLDFYANLGCDVINESHDQDTTDLHKCILHLSNLTSESEKSNLCVLVTGALGGRFDHEAGNINVLYRFSNLRIILLSDDCLIQLLPRTHHHEIQIQSSVVGPHCGLLPVGERAFHTTTSGLKWNLDDTEMAFGGLLSTSNIVAGDIVSVRSDADLIWTVSIKK